MSAGEYAIFIMIGIIGMGLVTMIYVVGRDLKDSIDRILKAIKEKGDK